MKAGDRIRVFDICGVRSWKGHVAMTEALYRFAEENIKLFDASEKWDKNGTKMGQYNGGIYYG